MGLNPTGDGRHVPLTFKGELGSKREGKKGKRWVWPVTFTTHLHASDLRCMRMHKMSSFTSKRHVAFAGTDDLDVFSRHEFFVGRADEKTNTRHYST